MLEGFFALAEGEPPSITPPVRTVVFPPSYGVTSVLEVSTKTREVLAFSRLDCEDVDVDVGVDEPDDSEPTESDDENE